MALSACYCTSWPSTDTFAVLGISFNYWDLDIETLLPTIYAHIAPRHDGIQLAFGSVTARILLA